MTPNMNSEENDSVGELTNTEQDSFTREPSLGASSHRSPAEDEPRQASSLPFSAGFVSRQKVQTANRPTSAGVTSGAAFKVMNVAPNICPRCSKTVYSAEEIKAAGKVAWPSITLPRSALSRFCSSRTTSSATTARIAREASAADDTACAMVNCTTTVRRECVV